MSRYDQFLTVRRNLRRHEERRAALRATALLLVFAIGTTSGWFIRGLQESIGTMRRPVPHAEEPLASPVDVDVPDRLLPLESSMISQPPPEPVLDDPVAETPLTGSLTERLNTLSRSAPGPNSIWFYDLISNESIAIEGEKPYPAASTAKVPIVMYLYHQAATNRISLNQRVLVQKGDWADGTGVLQAVKAGQPFTLRELARLALVHSDNIATNVLLRTLGSKALVSYLRELGIRHDRDRNLISAQDLGLAFRHLWRMSQKYPFPWEEPLLFLKQNVFHDRLPAGIPNGVPVANKIGSVDRAFHDGGIVYHKDHPYILVVMTDGMGEKQAERFISRVSREVWRWQDDLS